MSNLSAILGLMIVIALPNSVVAQSAPAATGTTSSTGADAAARAKYRTTCAADIAKFCIGTATKTRTCLTTHTAELTTDCKSAVIERNATRAAKKS